MEKIAALSADVSYEETRSPAPRLLCRASCPAAPDSAGDVVACAGLRQVRWRRKGVNTYCVNYRCSNCYRMFLVQIPKGREAPLFFSCPNCEMKELRKTDREITGNLFIYDMINEFEIERHVFK